MSHSIDCKTLKSHRYRDLVRCHSSIPQLDSDRFDDAGVKDYLSRAEELGFEGGWTMEQVIGASPRIAPLEMLAYSAACTTRLRLGVAVLVTSLHDPLQLASAVTGVDHLSPGRLDLGVGHGGNFRPSSPSAWRRTFGQLLHRRHRVDEGGLVRPAHRDLSRRNASAPQLGSGFTAS